MGLVLILTSGCKKDVEKKSGTVTDIDGNVYHPVTIGTQVWMVENLKLTHYRNGDTIANVTEGRVWQSITEGCLL